MLLRVLNILSYPILYSSIFYRHTQCVCAVLVLLIVIQNDKRWECSRSLLHERDLCNKRHDREVLFTMYEL